MKWVASISRDYWIYLDITRQSFKIWEFWGEFWGIETFHRSKFSPATGVKVGLGIWEFCAISRRLISKIRFPHPISVADAIWGTRFDLRDSKRRALEHYFSVRICYMFLISKCRGDWDLGLCPTSVLALGEPKCNGKIRFYLRRNTFISGFCHRTFVLQAQVPKLCTDLVLSLLYILILKKYSKFTCKINFL